MGRNKLGYTHGSTGTKPTSETFEKDQRPNAQHFNWFWSSVTESLESHANEFTRLDSDNDGKVDTADEADNASAVGGQSWSDIQTWVGSNYLAGSDYNPEADTHDPPSDSDILNVVDNNPHGNEAHNPDFATTPHGDAAHSADYLKQGEVDLSGKADQPHGDGGHSVDYLKRDEAFAPKFRMEIHRVKNVTVAASGGTALRTFDFDKQFPTRPSIQTEIHPQESGDVGEPTKLGKWAIVEDTNSGAVVSFVNEGTEDAEFDLEVLLVGPRDGNNFGSEATEHYKAF